MWPGTPEARGGSPAAQCPLERGCTDRSAGGYADRPPAVTTCARATAACHRVQPAAGSAALLLGYTAAAVTRQAPAYAAASRPQGLGKTACTGGRTVAARGSAACGLLGQQRETHSEEQNLQEPAGEEHRGDQHTAGRRGHPSRARAERRRLQQRTDLTIPQDTCEVPDDEAETCEGVRVWELPYRRT